MTNDELQGAIRRNVKVLMAVRSIGSARELAGLLRRSENHLSRQLAGTRDWQLTDLPALSHVLRVSPAELLSDLPTVVGAAGAERISPDTGANTGRYLGSTSGVTNVMAQVIPLRRSYRAVSPTSASCARASVATPIG